MLSMLRQVRFYRKEIVLRTRDRSQPGLADMARLAAWLPSENYVYSSSDLLFPLPETSFNILAPIFAVVVYIPLIFIIPRILPRPFEARPLLALHNGLLLLISIAMFSGVVWATFKNMTRVSFWLFSIT